jgi:shikimate dehydrogenase
MMSLVGLIGKGLKHSISPQFQQAAFDHLGLDVRYELWDTEESDLQTVIEGIRKPLKLGANVTIPYKEAVIPLLDEVDPNAGRIGAVNTIVNREGRLAGYNTDSTGFLRALRHEGGFEPAHTKGMLLGAGGVARAAGYALVGAGVSSLVLTDIIPEKAQGLALDLERAAAQQGGQPAIIQVSALNDTGFDEAVSDCDLIVNCTPVGMKHSAMEGQSALDSARIPQRALVYDLVYNPIETQLLREAHKAGARILGGLAMLVYQGAAAFELWTGMEAPVDIMMQAAKEAL